MCKQKGGFVYTAGAGAFGKYKRKRTNLQNQLIRSFCCERITRHFLISIMAKRMNTDKVDVNDAKKLRMNSLLKDEENATALSKQKVVYTRKDEADTIIVRDVVTEKWNAFGVKGEDAIKNLYFAIIKLINENRPSLHGLKFEVGEKIINIINSTRVGDEIPSIGVIDNDDGIRKNYIDLNEKIRVDFIVVANKKKPVQVALLNMEKNDEGLYPKVSTGIYLSFQNAKDCCVT